MGAFSSSSRSSEGFPVVLNVYDLTPLNNYLYWFGLGIYHSGIEDDASLKLTGRPIPGWVNRLAKIGALCNCLLPESMRMPPHKQIAEYHVSSDGSESFSMMAALHDSLESDDTDQEKHLLSPSAGAEVALIKEVQR